MSKVNLLRNAKRSTSRDFKILDPDQMMEEDAPNDESNHDDPTAVENESGEESEDNDGNVSEKILSPESCSPLAAKDSGSDGEDGDALPNAKRVKRGRVVQDSDDET